MLERTAHVSQKASFIWDNISNLNSDLIWGLHTAGRSAVWRKSNLCSNISPIQATESTYQQGITCKELNAFWHYRKSAAKIFWEFGIYLDIKFGKPNVVPHLENFFYFKKIKNLNYDSITGMATSISNTMLINAFMINSFLYRGNWKSVLCNKFIFWTP